MIKILFFAQLRERLGVSELILEVVPPTVSELRDVLSEKGKLWQELLQSGQCLAAVNQTISPDETTLNAGDEVAFFPPVTGG